MELLAASVLIAHLAMGDMRLLMKAKGYELNQVGCSGSCGSASAVTVQAPVEPSEPEAGMCAFPAALPCELE